MSKLITKFILSTKTFTLFNYSAKKINKILTQIFDKGSNTCDLKLNVF